MYVFVATAHSRKLVEMTPAELKAARAARGDAQYPRYEPTSGTEAHRWVKDGGLHETPLWVDINANRVRYARDN